MAKADITRAERLREWRADIERADLPGWCYFIESSDGTIKIGQSNSPASRLHNLRRETGNRLQLVAQVRGWEWEPYYHALFRAHRLHGEWFARHPDILAEIERLAA